MSASKRRAKRPAVGSARGVQASGDGVAAPLPYVPVAMPDWKWKTFPVYFALSMGGFIGLYFGVLVQAAENSALTYAVFVVFALLLGFGLSRLTTRFLISRNWVKPRPAKRRRS